MRDAYSKFQAAGIRLYAISYDDQEVLSEFSNTQKIPYPLLSDLNSDVIRKFGILNDQIEGDPLLSGIPFPGSFVADESGLVVAKFFHDSYKKRDSPESLIDAALGRVELPGNAPQATTIDQEVRLTAAVQGGKGSLRQGIIRQLIVRFELAEGLHIYGEPVPEGMIPAHITVEPRPGLVVLDTIRPPSRALRLEEMGIELQVWSGTVDFIIPFYPTGEMASETRPLDMESTSLEINVRFQACDDQTCLLPRTEKLEIELPLDVIDVPAISVHMGHGQREADYDGMPHMRRLLLRKIKRKPLGVFGFVGKAIQRELAALRRRFSP